MNAQEILTKVAHALVQDCAQGRIHFLREADNRVCGIWCASVPSVPVEEAKGDNMLLEETYLCVFCTSEKAGGAITEQECQALVHKFSNGLFVTHDDDPKGGRKYLI